jgi:uroporphyrinogen decarboxylase
MISPSSYRKLVKPRHARLFELIRSRSRAKIMYHCCGSAYCFMEDFIEIGVDIINPVQVSAADMDTTRLKAEFGDRISFWGGIDTQSVLPHGTETEVCEEVERRIADLAPGGGYVLAPVHNIQPDVPPENIVAMCDHAKAMGTYPIGIRGEKMSQTGAGS